MEKIDHVAGQELFNQLLAKHPELGKSPHFGAILENSGLHTNEIIEIFRQYDIIIAEIDRLIGEKEANMQDRQLPRMVGEILGKIEILANSKVRQQF